MKNLERMCRSFATNKYYYDSKKIYDAVIEEINRQIETGHITTKNYKEKVDRIIRDVKNKKIKPKAKPKTKAKSKPLKNTAAEENAFKINLYNFNKHYKSEDYESALNYLNKIIAKDTDNYELWLKKGCCHLNLGKYKLAKECYEKSLEIKPDFKEAREKLDYLNKHIFKSKENKDKIDVCISHNKENVYYLYDYIPDNTRFPNCKNYDFLSKHWEWNRTKLYPYKNDESDKITLKFTKELMEAIAKISSVHFKNTEVIALVPVPSSDMTKSPQTKKSVLIIEDWFKKGITEREYSSKKCFNSEFNNILNRIKTIKASKNKSQEEKIIKESHKMSIGCEKTNLPKDIGFIILDDITSSGTTIEACKEILIENGANKNNIIGLAIAESVKEKIKCVDGKITHDKKKIILQED